MNFKSLVLSGVTLAMLMFTSCQPDDDVTTPSTPATFDSTTFADAVTHDALNALSSLSSLMKTADPTNGSNAVLASDVITIIEGGTLSLEDLYASSSFAGGYAETADSFEASSASGTGNVAFDFATPSNSPDGGNAGDHLFNGQPLEVEQLLEKGSYGAGLFNYTKNTLFANPATITREDLDAALVLYGSDPTFETKKFTAKYAANRSYSSSQTFHDAISVQFIAAQVAILSSNETATATALDMITELWEKAIAAQAIYYFTGVASDAAFNPDYDVDADNVKVADAIHGWSEGVSFVSGFSGVSGTIISDAEVVSILFKTNSIDDQGDDSNGVLGIVNDSNAISTLNSAIDELATIYGLDKTSI
ncbi:hypothetical protein OAH12_00100 [Cyclobacteriaceae bacterium]|nr:hypothetical protein [Cyclobacteriaceae bacterium]